MKTFLITTFMATAMLCSRAATVYPTNLDLFDVSQGATVTATSGYYSGSAGIDMFGADDGFIEQTSTLFKDGQSSGYVHYIEFSTVQPITLDQIRLFAAGDGALYSNEREFSKFTLKAKSIGSSTYNITVHTYTPSHPYTFIDATSHLVVDQVLGTPVTAQHFRAEFENYVAGRGYDGPRIMELEGFGGIMPSTSDLFDVSQGTTVTASSGTLTSWPEEAMFGATLGPYPYPEPTTTYFADDMPWMTWHWVEFSTAAPVSLSSIRIFGAGDGPVNYNRREFASFVLKAKGSGSSTYNVTIATFNPTHPYTFLDPDTLLIYNSSVTPLTAQHFRAEILQYSAGPYHGPRIIELDGF